MVFRGVFLPALYQPPSPWFPGGKLEAYFTPALQTQMGGHQGFLPGAGADLSHQGDSVDDTFTPALMQRGDDFLPGKKMDDTFTPSLMDDIGGGLMPGPDKKPKDERAKRSSREGKYERWDCPNWLDPRLKGTPGYYPHALASFFHWSPLQHRPFPPEGFIFGDSGGYTVMTQGASIDPRDVIRWQIKNCKVGVLLDVPPVDKHGDLIFQKAIEDTQANTRIALKQYKKHLKEGGAFRWWGVVHGWTVEDMERWWLALSEVYPFSGDGEGWAFKPRPNINPQTTARVLYFIKQHKEIRRAHLLMTTGVDAVATLLCLGPAAGLEFASYDSTTSTLMAVNRTLIEPTEDGLGWEPIRELGADRRVRAKLQKHCQCFSCEQLRGDIERYPDLLPANEGWTGYWVYRFAYHNLLCMINVFENLRVMIKAEGAEPALEKILGRRDFAAVQRTFETGVIPNKEDRGHARGLLDLI